MACALLCCDVIMPYSTTEPTRRLWTARGLIGIVPVAAMLFGCSADDTSGDTSNGTEGSGGSTTTSANGGSANGGSAHGGSANGGSGGSDVQGNDTGSGGAAGGSSSTGEAGSPGSGGAATCDVEEGGVTESVPVPAGEFAMGCNSEVDDDCADDELPQRTIEVSAFEIDITEVTQDQYLECVQQGSCSEPHCQWDCSHHTYPAACVTRAQAMAYCSWVGKRLPTEAEWEKAARGTAGLKYPWGNEEPDCELANLAGCRTGAAPVGSFPAGASPYGALDMAGNVVEMLSDWYDPDSYATMSDTDPEGPDEPGVEDRYVGRGGGFKSYAYWARAGVRDWYVPSDQGTSLGFRCAR